MMRCVVDVARSSLCCTPSSAGSSVEDGGRGAIHGEHDAGVITVLMRQRADSVRQYLGTSLTPKSSNHRRWDLALHWTVFGW